MGASGDVFGTAISGLLAFQRGLHTTSHNISNSATEGYSRQVVSFETRQPSMIGTSSLGTGVDIASVKRAHDEILEGRLNGYTSTSSYHESIYEYASQIDELLANSSASIGESLQDFFGAVQTVADTPSSLSAREVMVAEGEGLASRFNELATQFEAYNDQVNSNIRIAVDELNTYAQSVADLNNQIVLAGGTEGSFPPNDLMDERDLIINKMSELVNISTVPKNDGSVDIFIGKGQALVLGANASNIVTQGNEYDAYDVEVAFDSGSGSPFIITDVMNGGKIGGLLEVRDTVISKAENTLGRLATGLIDTFNQQHSLGMDLEGDINNNFFSTVPPDVMTSRYNTGSGVMTASVTDISLLPLADYEISYDGTDYIMRDTLTNQRTTIPGSTTFPYDTGLGFSLDLTGAMDSGDSFLVRPTGDAARQISMEITEGKDVAAAAAVKMESYYNNQGDARLNSLQVTDITNSSLLNDVTITFTSPTSYDIVDNTTSTTLATGVAYTDGDAIAYNGWELTLSGSPAANDEFTVTTNKGATGDNSNMLALGELQTGKILANGTESFGDSYAKLVSDVGVTTLRAEQSQIAQQALLDNSLAQKASISGVNLDEEAANLMRYQQAYSAAARVMTTANTVFQTLLDAVR